jgi:hypothetical protein
VPAGAERDLACLLLLRNCWPGRQDPYATRPAASPSSPAVPLLPRLGRFEVRRELGRGAFGRVFLAHDPQLRRDVASRSSSKGDLPGRRS